MESHIRVKFTANLTALQDLDAYTYKVLMYLATRSDSFGVCFPAPKTIAEHIGISRNCVYDKLEELFTWGYAKLLRNAFYDRLTKKSTPAVFQVSPHFLEIADKFYEESLELWNTGFQIHVKHESNQQQEPTPEQTAFNQPQETTTTTNNRDSENKGQGQKQERPQRSEQRSEKSESSALVKNYTNPVLISEPLSDVSEQLAQNLADIEIKIILARGFIQEYGFEQCNLAYKHLQFLLTRQQIDNPSGFYRYLLQSNMANVLPSMVKKEQDFTGGEYADFVKS